ncbi:hypothetical protein D1872_262980 [compost metagenome]
MCNSTLHLAPDNCEGQPHCSQNIAKLEHPAPKPLNRFNDGMIHRMHLTVGLTVDNAIVLRRSLHRDHDLRNIHCTHTTNRIPVALVRELLLDLFLP